ncbi:MAG: undecaprenyldiphospho-muramoylpentapeptide beta-N-acetylglucosaminyltransferase [Clostridia bacterium]|nr:undecaprenyldiphospho-muramoylpentapeptide beta-N-acetylglucosaminyltransferase [Clostridia bacterium]
MRVLMTGGGTGGHVNPALAIANMIREKEPDAEIAFVGTSHGIENKLVPKEGYPLYHIEIRGLRRSLSLSNLKTALLVFTSVIKGKKLIDEFKPDIVIGTGGYACWPILKAASLKGVPTALHESNAVPGVAVKMLENAVDRVFINFEESRAQLKHPDRAVRVGNPLRMKPGSIRYEDARKQLGITGNYRYFILSCGGSMGAEQVNFAMLDLMKEYTSKHPEILHVHATGAIEYEETKKRFEEAGLHQYPNIRLLEYIYDMPLQMTAADLVIARAGSITLSELALGEKACILIPSPNVTNNHQYKNAKVLADRGAAILIEEKDITPKAMTDAVVSVLNDTKCRHSMQESIRSFAVSDAAEKIYDSCKQLILEKQSNV